MIAAVLSKTMAVAAAASVPYKHHHSSLRSQKNRDLFIHNDLGLVNDVGDRQ